MPILATANCDDQAGTGGVMKVTPDTECTLVKQTSRQGNDHCFRWGGKSFTEKGFEELGQRRPTAGKA